ncbi:DNA cytosine methyltransferase [Candidatus Pacearchaeota archaeon]|nr:DNA cytosine methyltransferase [Candidatus Pacearchaeota archaeon]
MDMINCIKVGEATEIKGHDLMKRVYSREGKSPTLNSMNGGNREPKVEVNLWRRLSVVECERLQTVPDNYTLVPWKNRMMSNSQRYKMLGNGWTIDVITHILKGLK